jgi:hypothetical protein
MLRAVASRRRARHRSHPLGANTTRRIRRRLDQAQPPERRWRRDADAADGTSIMTNVAIRQFITSCNTFHRSSVTRSLPSKPRRTMMRRPIAMTPLLMLGLWNLGGEPTAIAQAARDAQAPARTLKRSIVEGLSASGNMIVLSEVVDETVRRDARTSQRTSSQFTTDTNGRRRLVSVMEEQRVDQQDGGHQITREFMELNVDGRSRVTRREREQLTARGNGRFATEIEVTEPSINGSGFVPTERIEQSERRTGDQVVERETTWSINPTGRGRWSVLEQRVLTRDLAGGSAEAVELIQRPDSSGSMVQSERIVSREWAVGAQTFHTDEIYRRDINNGGSLTRQPVQHVEIVRTTLSDGGLDTARTVSSRVGDRLQVIESAVEHSRPDGRGGLVIEEEVQRSVVDGRFHIVATGTRRESQ